MTEEWRAVPDHPDYEVSSLGRVRSWKRCRTGLSRLRKLYTDKLGYVRVTMDGVTVSVHRAIAEAWHGPCPEGKEVDHINEVRSDNRAENLRYLTRRENMARMTAKITLTTECSKGHQMSGDNLYIRPSNGRRICRTCAAADIKKLRNTSDLCSYEHCTRPAFSRRTTDSPICEMHYQRERRQAS